MQKIIFIIEKIQKYLKCPALPKVRVPGSSQYNMTNALNSGRKIIHIPSWLSWAQTGKLSDPKLLRSSILSPWQQSIKERGQRWALAAILNFYAMDFLCIFSFLHFRSS